ncbi:MAG: homoaconitase [Phycisphaerales bacterium]|nr:MAG: homoaconitase [Phycisphaerales bacterium]
MRQTLIEKIAGAYATGLAPDEKVHAGDYVSIRPRHVMTHDNTAAVMSKFRSIGAVKVFDPKQPVFAIDHDIQNRSPENLAKCAAIQAFAQEHGVAFYPPGTGIGHQVMVEEGYVQPGSLVVASDSHANLYGALAAVGTPVVRTDAAALWATGETWWEVPDVVRVELIGRLRPGVTGKDVIIALCGAFNRDEVLNCAVEFTGEHLADLSMDQRMSISNMTTEWGALAGVFPFDEVLRDYLYDRADAFARRGDEPPAYTRDTVDAWYANRLEPDPDAFYAKELTLELDQVAPHVSGPNNVKTITAVSQIERQRIRVHKAYLLSCVNARFEDLAEAARIVKGKRVADHVKLYVAAASAAVEERSKASGDWQALIDAGAKALPPGCGPCIGLGEGTLDAGEVGISATNRNFKGRMGSRDAQVYLASPAVVAASAVAGYICGPEGMPEGDIVTHIKVNARPAAEAAAVEIIEGFPRRFSGRLLLLPHDNLNTDGIYGKDYTYREDMTPQEMGRVAMLNYDPKFQDIAREGDIIVGGRNFGSGSSREQAATALAFRGIRMVVAASFSQTYKRNAFNNGFVVIECAKLVDDLREQLAARIDAGESTIPTETDATVEFASGRIAYDNRTYPFTLLGRVPQELVAAGGTEALVRNKLRQSG